MILDFKRQMTRGSISQKMVTMKRKRQNQRWRGEEGFGSG